MSIELNLEGQQHREAVELLVSICKRYQQGNQRTIYPTYNPPGERGEIYLYELEQAGLVRVQYHPADPAVGETGTTTIVEPTEKAYTAFQKALEKVRQKTDTKES